MQKYNLYIFLILLDYCFSVISLWNFQDTVTDLLDSSNSYSYSLTLYENTFDDKKFEIKKIISKEGGVTKEKKILKIGTEYEKETEWEDIESMYKFDKIYICPRGRNYLNKYDSGQKKFVEIKPSGYTESKDWDLICYYQKYENYFFMAFANNDKYIYYSKSVSGLSTTSWYNHGSTKIHQGLCDFKWTINKDTSDTGNNNYLMTEISIRDDYVTLQGSKFTINGNSRQEDVNRNDDGQGKKRLIKHLSNSYGYFNKDDYSFYFFSYNETYFYSGYYETTSIFQNSDINNINPVINEISPLDFFYNFKIQKIKYLRNTNYIYYEIYNEIIEQKYYGFIDIKLNQVIFNTDKEILSFNKISSNNILIRTKESAYSFCKIKEGNTCIDTCSSNQLIINSLGSNFCGTGCPNLIMKPNNICIDECDENKFYKKGNECGLCKDLDENKKYKLINSTGCIENIPEEAEIYIEKNNILKCKEGHNLVEGRCSSIPKLCNETEGILRINNHNNKNEKNYTCIPKSSKIERFFYNSEDNYFTPCYETCLTCIRAGNKINNNCLKCEYNFIKKPGHPQEGEGNCVVKCNYFYLNSFNQYKCVESLPCPKEAKVLIKGTNQCIENCKKVNKFRYNGECLDICPNKTTNIEKYGDNFCIDIEQYIVTKKDIDLNYTSFVEEINTFVERYSEEFGEEQKHVTQFQNEEYNAIIMYKDEDGINELNLDFPNFDFGKCYEEVKLRNNITQELIVVIINKNDEDQNPETSYSFYHPITGQKIETEEICKEYKVKVIENITSILKNMNNSDLLMSLTKQGINIFDKSDKFFTDICYDYDINTNKDVAFKDRLKLFYPNVTLCDEGCVQIGVNLEKMTANCECDFNDISKKEDKKEKKTTLKDNILVENLMGNVLNFIDSSNIGIGKCLNKSSKKIIKNYGLYISLFIILLHTIMALIYFFRDIKKIQIYIYENTSKYIKYISFPENINNMAPPRRNVKFSENKYTNEEKKEKEKIKKFILKTTVNVENIKIKNLNILTSNKNHEKDSNQSFLKFEKNKNNLFLTENHIFKIKNSNKKNKYKIYFDQYFSKSFDEMEFDEAIIEDHRIFLESFLDCLKAKQIILNSFWVNDPFKPRAIKIILFSLTIFLHFVINALFINDSYVSEVYNLEEEEHFLSFVPRSINRIFYATLVGLAIEFIVDFFFVKEKKMKGIFIREKNDSSNIKMEIVLLLDTIKRLFIYFIIFVYIILGLCLYYLLCFNSIYPHMQIEWIKSSIFIIFIRQFLSVLQCLLETCLRILSFKYESERIFKISKLIN